MNIFVRNKEVTERGLDARWFLALKSIKRPMLLRSLTLLGCQLLAQKDTFLADVTQNPRLEQSVFDRERIVQSRLKVLSLRSEVCHEERSESIRSIYVAKLTEIESELDLLLASVQQDWSGFMFANKNLYGECRKELVWPLLSKIKNKYGYFQTLPPNVTDVVPAKLPGEEVKASARLLLQGPDIIVDPQAFFTSSDIVKLWQATLNKTLPNWRVISDDRALQVLVSHSTSTIRIPEHTHIRGARVRKLFLHEVGTHVYRRSLGKQSRLQLLSIGLPGYQRAEEGIAMVREQLIQEKMTNFGGHDKYLAIALATGAVDGQPRDFKDTFVFLKEYFSQRHQNHYAQPSAEKLAIERAWNITARIFRGGDPNLPGCCFIKDKIYREGNIYIWDLLEHHPDYFKSVFCGKFDPGNAVHRKLVEDFQ